MFERNQRLQNKIAQLEKVIHLFQDAKHSLSDVARDRVPNGRVDYCYEEAKEYIRLALEQIPEV